MDRSLREAFNSGYSPAFYQRYLDALDARVGAHVPFRVAETPLFLPLALRRRLASSAREIVDQIARPEILEKMTPAIPDALHVPGQKGLAHCVQVDFAIARDEQGELAPKLVELQGFPSLYALMALQNEVCGRELGKLPGLPSEWSLYFGGHDADSYKKRLRTAIVGDFDPEEVVLVDLDPPQQKTYVDFLATKEIVGIDPVCITALRKDGRTLYREKAGRRIPVKRIFNRVVFDEILKKKPPLSFDWRDDLDVDWFSHPNWYWLWSKYTVPFVDHPSVPKARFLADLEAFPDERELANYVLKPLFSFAGSGVVVDVTPAHLANIPKEERSSWILQEKIQYAPALITPEGAGVKAEVRMMFLRSADEARPTLLLDLVRLSRGTMLGVDQNRDFDWVGGSVGIWPASEAAE
jgi:hypothetical protein